MSSGRQRWATFASGLAQSLEAVRDSSTANAQRRLGVQLGAIQSYLAVRGTDRDSDIGSEHDSECRGQLNSESTVEGKAGESKETSFIEMLEMCSLCNHILGLTRGIRELLQ